MKRSIQKSQPPGAATDFWELSFQGKNFRGILEHNFDRNVADEFVGQRVTPNWSAPKVGVSNHGEWPDWMAYLVPAISKRGYDALREELESNCQVLPWFTKAGHSYFLINVLTRIPKDEWDCESSSVYKGIYASAEGVSITRRPVPPIFELDKCPLKIFVSDSFAKKSIAAGLTAGLFVHPAIRSMQLGLIKLPQEGGFVR